MKIPNQRRRKRNFHFFLIFLLFIVLSIAIILVAQQARAVERVYSVKISTVNGAWPPPVLIPNPVELTGNFSALPGVGLEKEYGIQIGWGDSSPYTVWRWSDANNSWPYLTWNPLDENAKYFTGTYNTNPGGGYPNLGHNYTTGGNYTITVKFFHGQPPGAESADATVSITQYVVVPEISVSKSGPTYAHEGDLITYNITVSNPSNSTTMYKVSVIDSLLGDKSASFSASLAPLASESETYTYTVPTPSGNITNTVTATYKDILNEQKTASASCIVTVLHPSIQAAKTGPLYAHEGDLITYNITVSNPSNGTMTRVSVIDSLLGNVSGSFSASLAPLASESETFTYTVPTPSGNISNTVTVTYKDAGNQQRTASASWTITVLHPGISVSKSGPNYAHEGDTITYTITVSNTGDCPLYSVSVTDTILGSIYSNGLAFGETKIFTVNYTVPTPSGDVSNNVTASGSDVLGGVKGMVSDEASWFVKVQYLITVTASPAGAIGGTFNVTYTKSGTTYTNVQETTTWTEWVDSSTTVTVSNPQDPFNDGPGTRYRFDHYDPSASVSMTEPTTITLMYAVQYYLDVVTDPSNLPLIPGADWYDNCTWVNLTAPQYVPNLTGIGGVRYNFTYWDVDGTSQSMGVNPIDIHMNAPHIATAHFMLQYLVTFDQTGLDGTAVGTVVTVDSSAETYGDLPFSEWVNNGTSVSYGYEAIVSSSASSKRFKLVSVAGPASPTTVTSPVTVTGNYVTQYNVTFDQTGVGSDFMGTVVTIDTVGYGVGALPVSFWWDENSVNTFSFASPLAVNTIKQYVWSSTSGLSTLQNDPLTVTTSGSVVGNYILQNAITFDQLGVSSDFTGTVVVIDGTPYGVTALPVSFYWPIGSTHNFAFQSPLIVTADTKQYVWTSTNGLSSAQNGSITVTTYGSIVGNYKTQYYLNLATSPSGVDSPTGEGWYDESTSAPISTAQYVDIVAKSSRYRFNGWTTGNMTEITDASANSTTVFMDEAKTVTANYVTQYYLTITASDNIKSDGEGTIVTVDGSNKTRFDFPFTAWLDSGTPVNYTYMTPTVPSSLSLSDVRYRFDNVTLNSTTSSSPSGTFNIDGPTTITGNYVTQYRLLINTNPSEVLTLDTDAVSGQGWYDSGTNATVDAVQNVDKVAGESRYDFRSWTGATPTGIGNKATVYIDDPKTVAANYQLQYNITFAQSGVGTDFNDTVVIIDSVNYNVTTLPSSFWWDNDSTHTFAFQSPLTVTANAKQYVWNGTSGLSSSQSDTTTVSTSGKITGNYKTQYYITVTSAHNSPTASTWVDKGNNFTTSVTSPADIVPNDHQWVCTGFSVDGGAYQAGITYTFTNVQTAHSIGFAWKEQFWIQVNSGHDTPTASQWVDQGNSLTVGVTSPADDNGMGTRYRCIGYTLDSNPQVTDGSTKYTFVNVQNAHTITFNWIAQYRLTVSSNHDSPVPGVGDQWYDAGTHIDASVTSPADESGGTRYRCTGYTGTGSVSSSSGTSVGFDITAPSTLTWNWMAQYYLTVTSAHDTPSGQGWYNSDATAYATLTDGVVSGSSDTQYVFTGWSGDASGSGLTSSGILMNGPKTATAKWKTQYYLTVNNGGHGTASGGGWYDSGTSATFSITPTIVNDGAGIRYVFAQWSGASTSTNPSATILMNGPKTATANWKTQYYLTVTSAHDTPGGQGWYDAGSSAYATLATGTVSGGTGIQYVFTGWSGDASGTGLTSNAITMNGPKTATAQWKAQYKLTMATNFGTTSPSVGDYWYDAGSVVTISATAPSAGSGERYVWNGWTGTGTISYTGTANPAVNAVTMNGPISEAASWTDQYYLTVTSVYDTPGGEGWYDSGATAYATLTDGTVSGGTGTLYVFTRWSGDASGTNYAQSDPILMNGPKTATANWKTQFYLTVNTDPAEVLTLDPFAVSGEGWYDSGSTATVDAVQNVNKVAGQSRYDFRSWTEATPTGMGNQANVLMNGPKTATANYQLQYYLTLATSPSGVTTPSGDGWYDAGTYADISTAEFVDIVAGSSRYRFDEWTTTDMNEIYDPSAYSTKVLMDKAKIVTANYVTQYYLTVKTEPEGIVTISGEGWYDEGANVTLTAPMYVQVGDVHYRFDCWKVDTLIVPDNPTTVYMDAPHTATARYALQYPVTFDQSGLDASTIGTVMIVDGSAEAFSELPFTMWVDYGTNVNYGYMTIVSSNISGKRFRLDHVTGPVSPINVTEPTTVTGNYITQYQITFDQSGVGSDFTGTVATIEGTNYGVADFPKLFWWDKDSSHSFAYDSPLLVDAGKRYVWANTTELLTLQSATLTVTTPGNITGNYETLYYLNVVSQYGDPYGTGWYLLSSEAKFGVTTPVDHGNRTIRVFTKWSGDVNIFMPVGTLIITKPSTVIASWETQYLVTFNTTLPNRVVLSIPGVPEIHPPGMEVFGMYYPAGDLIAAGPAPYIVAGTEGTRYVFARWVLDAQAFTSDANVSLVVDGPHDVAVAYEIEHLLVINAIGVSDPFTATVMIATSTPTAHNLTPTSPIQEWLKHGVQATLTISTPNKIGHGEWAIFREWSGQAQGLNRTVSFAMSAPSTVNAVFFKVNPVAESIPYSILSGLICMFLSCLIIRKKRKGQGRKTSLPITLGIMVSAAALIVAAVVSASIALGYGINVNELLDFTNWAVLFIAAEAIILLLATAAVTTWINRRLYVQP